MVARDVTWAEGGGAAVAAVQARCMVPGEGKQRDHISRLNICPMCLTCITCVTLAGRVDALPCDQEP